MFTFADKNINMDIGSKNVDAVKLTLSKLNIPIVAEDVRGNKGRTMIVYFNGEVNLRIIGDGIKII